VLHFDRTAGRYVAAHLTITTQSFSERLALLMAGGERPGAAFERLLDESEWNEHETATAQRRRVVEELPAPDSLLPLTLVRSSGETLRARVMARSAGRLELRIVPAPQTLAAGLIGALVEFPAPHGRRLLGQIEHVTADGSARLSVMLPEARREGERRIAPRYLPLAPTHGYELMDQGVRNVSLRVTLTDLGPTGFGFVSPHPLPAGIAIALQLPAAATADSRVVRGRVVWLAQSSSGWRVGATNGV
jgi:hypothetical protein